MKKEVLTSLVVSTILATSVFAYGAPSGKTGGDCISQSRAYGVKQNFQKQKPCIKSGFDRYQKQKKSPKGKLGVIKIFRQLGLSQEQKDKFFDILSKQRKDMVKLSEAFGVNGFDQSKYESLLKQKRDNRIKKQADLTGKLYSLLTDRQKVQFKTLLELHEDKQSAKIQSFKQGYKNW